MEPQPVPPSAPLTPLGAKTPHAHPALPWVIGVLSLIIVGGAYWVFATYDVFPDRPGTSPTSSVSPTAGVEYRNEKYGLLVKLPESWRGFRVASESQDIYSLIGTVAPGGESVGTFLTLHIQDPTSTAEVPRQDIPVMVFTMEQWNCVREEKCSVGAAPIPPSYLASNFGFVFALPARYNYAFPEGWEEVDAIIQDGPVSGFNTKTDEEFCTGPQVGTEIGALVWPTAPKYESFGYLGAVLTAADCGSARLEETFGGGDSDYRAGVTIELYEQTNVATDAAPQLRTIGFTPASSCLEGSGADSQGCRFWEIHGDVPIRLLLPLRDLWQYIRFSDCIDCG